MMSGWTGDQQPPANSGQEKKAEPGQAGDQENLHQQQHQQVMEAALEAARLAHTEAHSAAQAGAGAGAAAFLTETQDYLQNVGSYVAAALDPLGIDVKIDIETPEGRKSCHASRQTSTASASTSVSTSATQEQEKEKKEEKKEEVVINEEKKADSAPAK